MKSHRIATFILFTFIATACASPPSRQISKPSAHLIAKSLEKSIETASSAIVVINTNIAQGSGVLLSSDGVVVTNLHVLEGAGDITVQLQSGSAFTQVDVIGFDAKRDIALLKVHGKGLPFAELSASQDLRRGRAVFTIGAPSGLTQTVSRGIVSAIRTENPEYELIQTDAAISPGSSGGGLFDDDGTLLGVVVSYRTDGQNLNFAIPAKYIMPLLDLPVSYSEAEFLAINAKTESKPQTMRATSAKEKIEGWIKKLSVEYKVEYAYDEKSKKFVMIIGDDIVFIIVLYEKLLMLTSEIIPQDDFDLEERNFIDSKSISADFSYFAIKDGKLRLFAELPLVGTEYDAFEAVIIGAVLAYSDIVKEDFITQRLENIESTKADLQASENNVIANTSEPSNSTASLYKATLPDIKQSVSTANLRKFTPENKSWQLFFNGFDWEDEAIQGEEPNIILDRRNGNGVARVFFEDVESIVSPELALPLFSEEYVKSLEKTPNIKNVKILERGQRQVQKTTASWVRFSIVIEGFEVFYQTTLFYSEGTLVTLHVWRNAGTKGDWAINEEITMELLSNLRPVK